MNLEDIANEFSTVKDEDLGKVAELVRKQLQFEVLIQQMEDNLKSAKRGLEEVSGQLLPAALQEYGLSELTMADGSKISVQTVISASISKERQPDAHDWLRDHGHGDLIKNTVSVTFGRGQDDAAKDVVRVLQSNGLDPEQKEAVHPSTLKAFVKEQIEKGSEIPSETFGIFIGQKTVIKKGK
jgi:hypothetical protein